MIGIQGVIYLQGLIISWRINCLKPSQFSGFPLSHGTAPMTLHLLREQPLNCLLSSKSRCWKWISRAGCSIPEAKFSWLYPTAQARTLSRMHSAIRSARSIRQQSPFQTQPVTRLLLALIFLHSRLSIRTRPSPTPMVPRPLLQVNRFRAA